MIVLVFFGFMASSCGQNETAAEESGPVILINSGGVLITDSLEITPEDVVLVINNDTRTHTITSQSGEDAFDDTGEFDLLIPAQTKIPLILPPLEDGDVYYFYDRLAPEGLTPSTGEITVGE